MDQQHQQQEQYQQQQQPPYQYDYQYQYSQTPPSVQQHIQLPHEEAPPYEQHQQHQHQHRQPHEQAPPYEQQDQRQQQHHQRQQPHQQPNQPQPQEQQEQEPQKIDDIEALPVYTSPDRVWKTKLSLRIVIALICIIIVGLAASLIVSYDLGSLVLLGPPAFVSFVWSVCEAICIIGRGGHRGIHPGACVGMDLILWMGFAVSSTLYGLLGYTNTDFYHYYINGWPEAYNTPTETNSARAGLAFSILLLLLHFTLFVIACAETNIRNRKTRIIYVPATSVPLQPMPSQPTGLPPNYQAAYMPPQQQQQQQQQPVTYPSPVHSVETPVTVSPIGPPVHTGMR